MAMLNALGAFKEKNPLAEVAYDNVGVDPDCPAERFFLPKYRKYGKFRRPLSDDVELDFTNLDPEAM